MMKQSISKSFVVSLTVLALAGFAVALDAQARPGGGGGGFGGGGHAAGARAGGGGGFAGGGGANRQVNNSNRDVRANNVRNTSVNNVNVNNVNNVNRNTVVVNNNNNRGWDNDYYHPVATAAAVTAGVAVTAAVVGSMVNTVPANCVPVNYGGLIYQQCGNAWYQPQGAQYVVVNPPY